VVKQIGDEFMLVFPDAASAIAFGTSIQLPSAGVGELPPLRIGAHHGPVLYREGDYYGATVNVAARTTSVARGGQFIVTDAVRQQLTNDEQTRLGPLGPHSMKGITDPVELFEVHAKPLSA
jgi:class 3 adenylate cyclase